MAISVAMGAAAGSSPPAAVVQGDSRDDGAVIFCGTGASGTTTGVFATITLSGNYSATAVDDPAIPKFFVTFGYPNAASAGALLYVSGASTQTLTISAAAAGLSTGLAATAAGITIIFKMEG